MSMEGKVKTPMTPYINDISVPVYEPPTRDGLEQYVENEVDKCTYIKMAFFRDGVFNQLKKFRQDCSNEISKTLDLE